jgi:tetratricopeptide (TPR) repeat protein
MSAEEHFRYLAHRRRVKWIGVIVGCLGAFFILRAIGSSSKTTWLGRASLSTLREAEKQDPNDVDVLIHLSLKLMDAGHSDRAIPYMERAVKLQPDSSGAWVGLARLHAMSGHAVTAVQAYERALKLNPEDAKTRYVLAHTLGYAGLITDSLREFDSAYKRMPEFMADAEVWAKCLVAKGRWQEAWDHLIVSLEKIPAQDTPCQILTDVGIQLNYLDETEMRLRRRINFIRAYPSGVVRHALCRLLLHRSQDKKTLDEAEANARIAVTDQNPKAKYQAMLGHILLLKGDVAGAGKAARAALQLDANDQEANLLLASVLEQQGQRTEASAIRTRVAEASREDPTVVGRRRAAEAAPRDAAAQLALASALRDSGRPAEAAEACHAALQISPRSTEAAVLLDECRKQALTKMEEEARAKLAAQ